MAIFYPPPQPLQAVPKLLPKTPGSEPPRTPPFGGSAGVLAAVGMWVAQAAVPMPVQKPLTIVPLTLTYGQQPPRSGELTGSTDVADLVAILASWPAAGEPRPTEQQLVGVQIAPLTLVYGSQPAPAPPLSSVNAEVILTNYPQLGEPRLPPVLAAPPSAAWNIPPVNAPRPHTPYPLAVWIASPSPLWQPPALVSVAPLTLVYGSTPPPIGAMQLEDAVALGAWWTPSWSIAWEPESAGWNVPAVAASYVPPPAPPPSILQAWYQDPVVIVWMAVGAGIPLGGDQPVPAGPLTPTELAIGRAWDPPPWLLTQSEAGSAALIPAPVINNPPPSASPQLAAVVGAQWPGIWWPSQSEENNAGWNFVPPVINAPPPRLVFPIGSVFAWQPPPPLPVRPVIVAPLTLRSGQQPPVIGGLTPTMLATLVGQWPGIWWPDQSEGPAAPLTLVYGNQPIPIAPLRVPQRVALAAWPALWTPAQSAAPTAAWNAGQPVIIPWVVTAGAQLLANLAWQVPWRMPQRAYQLPRVFFTVIGDGVITVILDASRTFVVLDGSATAVVLDTSRTIVTLDPT